MTVKELKEMLAQHNDDVVVVIKEFYRDRDGWLEIRKVYNGYIAIEETLDK